MTEEVLLTSICRPKQWKTISSSDLHESGFPVYGANGKIGFYDTYTHEYPTVLITCRGATCGAINICEAKSYVNGNAMALDNLSSNVDMYYLKHYLEYRKLDDVISGSAQPQITGQGLSKVKIPLPPLPQQQKIAEILDAADALRQNDKTLLSKYDELTQALFLDMFGDIIINNKLFKICRIADVCKELFLGLTSKVDYVETGGFPLVRATDINKGVLDLRNVKYISEVQHKKLTSRRITRRGDVLISKSGSLGTCAIVDTDIQFSTYESIFTVRVNEEYLNNTFLVYLVRNDSFQRKLLGNQVGGTVAHLNLNMFRDFEFPLPSIDLQNQFAERVALIEEQKAIAQKSLEKSEELFNSLLQKAFKGELV